MIENEVAEIKKIYDFLLEFIMNYSFQLVGALIIFCIGLFVANKASKFILALMTRHKIDVTLSTFLSSLVRVVIVVMVAIICLGKLGVSVTPFVAAVGAGALGAGLAFQGLLSNYAAGITIIITRPFIVGNTICVQGVTGIVKEISIAATYITNADGVLITIPNKHIIGEVLHNSYENTLISTSIGVAYNSDLDKVIELINDVLSACKEVDPEQLAQVGVDEFADSAINIGIRFWVPTHQFFSVKYQVNMAIYKALTDAGVTIPFPQREVRMLNT